MNTFEKLDEIKNYDEISVNQINQLISKLQIVYQNLSQKESN